MARRKERIVRDIRRQLAAERQEEIEYGLKELIQGILIGFIAGVLKITVSIRKGTFQWHIAMADTGIAIVVGYVSYEVAIQNGISVGLATVWASILALNGFIVINALTNEETINKIINKYINAK